MNTMDQEKLEIQKQWDNDPCGSETVQDREPESLEFYRAIRKHRYEEYAPWFDEVVGFQDWHDKDILEIGVGLGSDHYRFAVNGNHMTALDLSKEHLRHTVKHLQLEGLETNPIYGDAEEMPFPDHSFDVVYSFGVLHHTPNTERAIAEVYRVLKPGGTAIIGLYHKYSLFLIFRTIIYNGILKAGLFSKGWRKLVSEIEHRSEDSDAVPLVKVYSRREAKRLFNSFARVNSECCHVEASHFVYFERLFRCLGRRNLERLFAGAGWYVVIHATKA